MLYSTEYLLNFKILSYFIQGIELARKMIKVMEENEGCAECFPYEEIDGLKRAFWLE